MKTVTLAAAAILTLTLTLPAQAQRSGAYAVEGTAADGTRYQGAVQLQTTGPETWRVTWRIGGETVTGIGIMANGVLSVGYAQARDVGVAWYQVGADGVLAGRWTSGREGGVGTERWLPR